MFGGYTCQFTIIIIFNIFNKTGSHGHDIALKCLQNGD
jgi:hypothetical protein